MIDTLWWLFGVRFLKNDAGKKPFKVDNRSDETNGAEEKTVEPLTLREKKRVAAIVIVTVFLEFSGSYGIWYTCLYTMSSDQLDKVVKDGLTGP